MDLNNQKNNVISANFWWDNEALSKKNKEILEKVNDTLEKKEKLEGKVIITFPEPLNHIGYKKLNDSLFIARLSADAIRLPNWEKILNVSDENPLQSIEMSFEDLVKLYNSNKTNRFGTNDIIENSKFVRANTPQQ